MSKKEIKEINKIFLADLLILMFGFSIIITIISLICKMLSPLGIDSTYVTKQIIKTVQNNSIIAMIISQGMIFIPLVIYIIYRRNSFKKIIRFKKISIVDIFLLTCLTYLLIPVMSFINMISMMVVDNKIATTIDNAIDKNPLWLSVLVLALLPAFVEESVCRGLMYNAHSQMDARKAILFNGLIFGILHGNLNQFAYAFFMGVAFSLITEATDSTFSSIWCHFVFNANSIVIGYAFKNKEVVDNINNKNVGYTSYDIIKMAIIAMTCLIFAIFLFIRIAKKKERWNCIIEIFKIKNTQSFISISLIISIVIGFVNMLVIEFS